MIATETVAKTKWCPWRHGAETTCVGSDCMMWSWFPDGQAETGFCGAAPPVIVPPPVAPGRSPGS